MVKLTSSWNFESRVTLISFHDSTNRIIVSSPLLPLAKKRQNPQTHYTTRKQKQTCKMVYTTKTPRKNSTPVLLSHFHIIPFPILSFPSHLMTSAPTPQAPYRPTKRAAHSHVASASGCVRHQQQRLLWRRRRWCMLPRQ